jgi:hypothetical protein
MVTVRRSAPATRALTEAPATTSQLHSHSPSREGRIASRPLKCIAEKKNPPTAQTTDDLTGFQTTTPRQNPPPIKLPSTSTAGTSRDAPLCLPQPRRRFGNLHSNQTPYLKSAKLEIAYSNLVKCKDLARRIREGFPPGRHRSKDHELTVEYGRALIPSKALDTSFKPEVKYQKGFPSGRHRLNASIILRNVG